MHAGSQKTVRKWAQRSIDNASGTGEITAQRQDTGNGFRWVIERNSLDLKIEQEKDFDSHANPELEGANPSAHVATGAHTFQQVLLEGSTADETRTDEHTSAPVGTGAHWQTNEMVELLKIQLEHAHEQMHVKDRVIDSLLERDRETNFLIQGLQTTLTGVVEALPRIPRRAQGDNSPPELRDVVQ